MSAKQSDVSQTLKNTLTQIIPTNTREQGEKEQQQFENHSLDWF